MEKMKTEGDIHHFNRIKMMNIPVIRVTKKPCPMQLSGR
jgi:hypothetical protein